MESASQSTDTGSLKAGSVLRAKEIWLRGLILSPRRPLRLLPDSSGEAYGYLILYQYSIFYRTLTLNRIGRARFIH